MVRRRATPEADTTITNHLPPPEGGSTQDVSMSFVIPPQADASNLLDQDYDDFFSGPGFVTMSTPVLPRHLANTAQSVRKAAGTIRAPAVVSGHILGQTLTTHSTTGLEVPDDGTTMPFTSMGPPTTSVADPGPPRLGGVPSGSDPDAKFYDGSMSKTALPVTSIVATKAFGTHPGVQSMPTSIPSHHSTNTQNAQISRQPPTPARKKTNQSVKSNQATSKLRGENVLDGETGTPTQSRVRGGVAKRLKPMLSNHGAGRVKGRNELGPASSNPRSNISYHAPSTGSERPDPDSLGDDAENYGAVTQSLVTTILPPPEPTQSRLSLASGGTDSSGSSPSLVPAVDHVGAKNPQETAEEERKDDDRVAVSRPSPCKTVRESSDRNDGGILQDFAPTPGTSIAVSPMRPSVKRALSAGHESDIEPGGTWPDEWEKRYLITESNWEGEVRGGEEGKEAQQARRVEDGEKPRAFPQSSRKKTGVASGSLALTRRLKAKAVRESPRVRKLRDKLAGRGTGRRRPGIGAAPKVSRGGHAMLHPCGFPENVGASTTATVAMHEGKGSDRASWGETTGPTMPYSGDNQQDGAIDRNTGGIAGGGPSFRSTLKRSTVPVEFRFELAARLGTSRGSAAKENPGPGASRSSREDERQAAGSLQKRPKLGELRGSKSGVVDFEEPSSSRLSEAKDDHHGQTGGHAGAQKGSTCSRSKISSTTSMSRSKRTPLIIPEAFRFSTEQRARDREKFDEAMRVKQREKERQLEEDRAAKAVEEERGIKEMRKRAVPKANSVPEWYATMPKRKAA